ncbi:UDP-N-acetylmuramoyl-L-alanine--D-glutamate ligase [Alkalicoccus daliensis]|uniref:UDP-N-acetylmuramoylalanine--D-glutamate ligase n=1 Tax=Alkalicoccus daliensis TaxID=745820 RepID=A0A1G9ZVT7_9BACI|nr:UDP-N-acetylmuramoyl-L-alanine--D-glutamate ligase [Alkalicoccus daliensis]SDN25051.1 UDP-N-acetylmuramoylalanine--D-glutamate ligase [Alkalicoccus daliensis]
MKESSRWTNKKVLVLGLAKSGTEAAKLLLQLGAQVTVNDQTPWEENEQAKDLQKLGAEVICGSHPISLIHSELDALIKNPGIRYDHELIVEAEKHNIPVLTEIQLAYDVSSAPIIGITGSNGKTTTTTYIADMLEDSKTQPLLAGNIGHAASGVAKNAAETSTLVMELSSFQLLGTDSFRPDIAVLLNLIDAHLDYHGTREEYIEAKKRLFIYQTPEDYLIYNADDETVIDMVKEAKAKKIPFSLKEDLPDGACLSHGRIKLFGEELMPVSDFSLPGDYNIANALAAACAAKLGGASNEKITEVMKSFTGVKHRLQHVGSWRGREFFNNSKATNVTATVKALQAFDQPIVLIAGGLDRGIPFDDLESSLKNVTAAFTYGETAEKLKDTAHNAGVPLISALETLEEAVKEAVNHAQEGEVILLSPACASWDQFKTFEERGDAFIRAVEKNIEEFNNQPKGDLL